MAKKVITPYHINGNNSLHVLHENEDRQLIGKRCCINYRGLDSKVTSFTLDGVEISQGGNDCSDFCLQIDEPGQEPFPYIAIDDLMATADLIYNS